MGRRRRLSDIECKFHPRCTNDNCKYNHRPRCYKWPNCPYDEDDCGYFHPEDLCRFGNRCRDPKECLFIHPWETKDNRQPLQASYGSQNIFHFNQNSPPITNINNERIPSGWVKVDKIIYNPDDILGTGSLGTTVFKGRFDERPVAVKRIYKNEPQLNLIDREVQLLRESDSHRNIVRYYTAESDKDYRYIALELCEHSLQDFVTKNLAVGINRIELLRQTTEGIAHLHQNNILHRDLKPHNILLSKDSAGNYRVLIADFGLCKQIPNGQNSVSHTKETFSSGWLAPEIYASHMPDEDIVEIYPSGKPSVTKACDVFSLGCIFYFVLTDGDNPFGHAMRRRDKLLQGKYDMSLLKNKLDNTSVDIAFQCIECMISHDYKLRPSIEAVLQHPYFWQDPRKLQFLADVSDRLTKEDQGSEIIYLLNYRVTDVIPKNWQKDIDADFFLDKTLHQDIRGLLRLIRNTKTDFHKLSDNAQSLIEKNLLTEQSKQHYQSGIFNYFASRFPKLFMHVYITMNPHSLELVFKDYYSEETRKFFETNNEVLFPMKKSIVKSLLNDFEKMKLQNKNETVQVSGPFKHYKNSLPPMGPIVASPLHPHSQKNGLAIKTETIAKKNHKEDSLSYRF